MAASGVFTDTFRQKYANLAAGQLSTSAKTQMPLAWFRVGEGGFTGVAPNKLPATPDVTRTSMVATVDMLLGGSSTSANGGFFSKALGAGKVTISGRTVTVVCELAASEANLDNSSKLTGNLNGTPRLFELGLFDGDPSGSGSSAPATLLAYCTFDEVIKVAGVATTLTITLEY